MNNDLARIEWEAWQVVCKALLEAKAITEEDLKRSKLDVSTPGTRLMKDIRNWAYHYRKLCQSE